MEFVMQEVNIVLKSQDRLESVVFVPGKEPVRQMWHRMTKSK